MHRCPQCDHSLGLLPGVPADPFGAFASTVACPECGHSIPSGAILVTGSAVAAGAGATTGRTRALRVALAALPMAWFVPGGVRGIADLAANGPTTVGMLRALGLLLPAVFAWIAWRHWTPAADDDGAAPASRDRRWLCTPGEVLVFETSGSAGTGWPGSQGALAQVRLPWAKRGPTRIGREDMLGIRAFAPRERTGPTDAGERIVSTLVIEARERGLAGRVRRRERTINVFTGSLAPADADATIIAVDAGDRIAARLRRLVGVGHGAGHDALDAVAPPADPASTEPPAEVHGATHATRPWPGPVQSTGTALLVLAIVAASFTLTLAMLRIGSAVNGRAVAIPVAIDLLGRFGAAALVVLAPAWLLVLRTGQRRHRTRRRWSVTTAVVRESTATVQADGSTVRVSSRDIPATKVVRVEVVHAERGARLRLLDRTGAELTAITLTALPEGGTGAVAESVRRRLAWW